MKTVQEAVERVRLACRATDMHTACSAKQAGYLHGLISARARVPRELHYPVLEVVFGCEIISFGQITFQTCRALIDLLLSDPDTAALLYTIHEAIRPFATGGDTVLPGDYKEFLFVCGKEEIHAYQG